jgi:hypothetical protein
MSTTIKKNWHWLVVGVLLLLGVTNQSMIAMGATPIFLTRYASTTATWPRSTRFVVGSTTPQAGKLAVYANVGETLRKLLQVASSTSASTVDLFSVNNIGCMQATATSTGSPIKLVFSTLGATTSGGTPFQGAVYFQAGTC